MHSLSISITRENRPLWRVIIDGNHAAHGDIWIIIQESLHH